VVSLRFANSTGAQKCIDLMNGRFFDGRQLVAEYWDRVTDYTMKETREDQDRRLEEFGKWLEDQDDATIAAAVGPAGPPATP
jgi:hypothetical protein